MRTRRFVALSPQDGFPLDDFSFRAIVGRLTFPDAHQSIVNEIRKRIWGLFASEMLLDVSIGAIDESDHSLSQDLLVGPKRFVGGLVSVGIRLVLTLAVTLALRHSTADCGAVSMPSSDSILRMETYLRSSYHLSHYLECPEHPRHC